MVFGNGVKDIQAATYNGARMVCYTKQITGPKSLLSQYIILRQHRIPVQSRGCSFLEMHKVLANKCRKFLCN